MKDTLRWMIMAALFATLTAVGAQVSIAQPFSSVPITLQVFFTMLSGVILGSFWGAISQIVYILLGCLGLPVFARGMAGVGVLVGPTGGYLIGFIVAAYTIGRLSEGRAELTFRWSFLAMFMGLALIYLFGVLGLMIILRLSLLKAIVAGVLPFIILDLLKAIAASYLAVQVKRRLRYS